MGFSIGNNVGANTSGGVSDNGLPEGYRYKLNNITGALELWQGNILIATQHRDGTWLSDSVTTGVGSFHLGEAHSVKSVGQNAGFLNEFSVNKESDRWLFFPPWQAIRNDGLAFLEPTYLEFLAPSTVIPNGASVAGTSVDYNFTATISSNFIVRQVEVWMAESYTGVVFNIIENLSGTEIYKVRQDVVAYNSLPLVIEYQPPFFARQGDQFRLKLLKEDGTPIKVRGGVTDPDTPYRQLYIRSFVDVGVAAKPLVDDLETRVTSLEAVNPASLTADRVLISDSSGNITTGVTASKLSNAVNDNTRRLHSTYTWRGTTGVGTRSLVLDAYEVLFLETTTQVSVEVKSTKAQFRVSGFTRSGSSGSMTGMNTLRTDQTLLQLLSKSSTSDSSSCIYGCLYFTDGSTSMKAVRLEYSIVNHGANWSLYATLV